MLLSQKEVWTGKFYYSQKSLHLAMQSQSLALSKLLQMYYQSLVENGQLNRNRKKYENLFVPFIRNH